MHFCNLAFTGVSHPTSIIERIRLLYKTREERLLPVPWCDDFSFHLNDIFTRLKIVGKEKTRGELTDEITTMTAIFGSHAECQKPRTVLIEGEPGMGKTTYCQKLAYDWAAKREEWDESFPDVEVLLLLRCRDIKSDIWDAIDDQVLPEDVEEEDKKNFFKFIRENQSKVLLLLDGLDEADPSKLAMYFDLLESKVLPHCHIVLTARHEAGKKVRLYCDTLWEIVGFTEKDAKSFIRNYFKKMEHLAEKLTKELWPRPWYSDPLSELTSNPLNTALLCVIYEDFKGILPTNRTELYTEIVLCVLRRYEKKNGLSSNSEDLTKVYKEELMHLGRMALLSLRKGDLYFEEQKFNCNASVLIRFGFLSVQAGGSKRKPCLRYGFLHKSFQEFFAGLYLAFEILNGVIDCDSVVTDRRYRSELKEVFLFMSGIIALQCENTTVSLVNSITAHINLLGRSSFDDEDDDDDVEDDDDDDVDDDDVDVNDVNVNRDLQFAFDCISSCKTNDGNLWSRLLSILGKSLNISTLNLVELQDYELFFKTLEVNACLTCLRAKTIWIDGSAAASLSKALTVNTCLTSLELIDNQIGDSGAASLAEALTVNTCLTSLDLSSNEIGASGAASLAEALTINTCLTSLHLNDNEIGDSGAGSLAEALKVNTCLTSLHLSSNEIGASGAASLAEALKVNTCLTSLDLSGNKIGASDAASLAEALTVNTCLTSLHLNDNEIGAPGAASLAEALTVNTCLTSLHLNYNKIGASGAASLAEALKVNTCLTSLDLNSNQIGDSGAASLAEALTVNTCLTSLDLTWNQIGESGAASLAEALTVNTCLTSLDLTWNQIGESGAASLSEALTVNTCLTSLYLRSIYTGDPVAASLSEALTVNTRLTSLDLRYNQIGASGAASLAEALTVNTCLTSLVLHGNQIGAPGAASLAEALKVNTCLTSLNLGRNKIGDSGAASLAEALKVNTFLTSLYLGGNEIGDSGAASLAEALKVNTCLTSLNLGGNEIGDSGAASLAEALKVNTFWTSLNLGRNEIGDSGFASLAEALKLTPF